MDNQSGPSEAWFEAVHAVGRITGQTPLPKGLVVAENDDWKLSLNNSGEPLDLDGVDLGKFECFVEGKKYIVFGVVAPSGGMIGGMPEDQFIAEMQAIAKARGESPDGEMGE